MKLIAHFNINTQVSAWVLSRMDVSRIVAGDSFGLFGFLGELVASEKVGVRSVVR